MKSLTEKRPIETEPRIKVADGQFVSNTERLLDEILVKAIIRGEITSIQVAYIRDRFNSNPRVTTEADGVYLS